MHQSLKLAATSLVAMMLVGCGTKESSQPVKQEPAKIVEAVFKSTTISQAKNMLLGACSNNKLAIKSESKVVTCETRNLISRRERELTLAIDDAYASDIREVFEFTLTEQGPDVQVKANSFAKYQAPISVMSANQTRQRNLLDETADATLKKLLTQAGAKY